jgi:hypothetical protein
MRQYRLWALGSAQARLQMLDSLGWMATLGGEFVSRSRRFKCVNAPVAGWHRSPIRAGEQNSNFMFDNRHMYLINLRLIFGTTNFAARREHPVFHWGFQPLD